MKHQAALERELKIENISHPSAGDVLAMIKEESRDGRFSVHALNRRYRLGHAKAKRILQACERVGVGKCLQFDGIILAAPAKKSVSRKTAK